MRKLIAILIVLVFCLGLGALAQEEETLNVPVKLLYSAPFEGSDLVYEIPIDVSVLDVSLDGDWCKVRISFNLGPLSYIYVGWANVPVQQTLNDREKRPTEIAKTSY